MNPTLLNALVARERERAMRETATVRPRRRVAQPDRPDGGLRTNVYAPVR
jgi:hypothetical protein